MAQTQNLSDLATQSGFQTDTPELKSAQQDYATLTQAEPAYKAALTQEYMHPLKQQEAAAYQDYNKQSQDISKQIEAPFKAPQMSGQEIAMHGMFIAALGAFLGGRAPNLASGAIDGMAKYNKAIQAGDNLQAQQAFREYQTNLQRLQQQRQDLNDRLQSILKGYQTKESDVDAKVNELAAIYHGGVVAAKMRMDAIKGSIDSINDSTKFGHTIKNDAEKLYLMKQANDAKHQPNYQPYVGKDGNIYAWDTKQGIYINRGKAPEGLTKAGAKTGTSGYALTAERVLQQDVGNAAYNLSALKDEYQKTGKIPAGSPAFANAFSGTITSDIIRYATTQNVDKGLLGNDALLVNLAYDIASAQTGGRGQLSDTKVKGVVSQMPLDSEPDEVKIRKWKALIHRLEEANKTLPKDKQVDISNDIAFIKQITGTSENTKDKIVTEQDVADYAKKHNLTLEAAKAHILKNGYTIK